MKRPSSDVLFDSESISHDLAGKSVRGGATTAGAQGIKFLLGLASTMILARLLTPDDFGLIGMVTVVVGFAARFKDAGLGMATVQREHITREQVSTLFWINVIIGLGLTVIVAALSPLVALFYGRRELAAVTAVFSLSIFLSAFMIQHGALLRRHMRFGALAGVQVASQAVNLLVAATMAWFGMGYWAIVGGGVASSLAGSVLVFVLCPWLPGSMRKGTGVREMLHFGGYLTGFSFVAYFARNLDNILIGWRLGAESLGLYSKAYGILMLPINQVNTPLTSVAVPMLSRLKNDAEKLRRYYRHGLVLSCVAGMPIVVFCLVKAEEVIQTVLGEQWTGSVPIFRALGAAAFIGATNGAGSGWIFVALGNAKRQFYTSLVRSVFFAAAFLIGLHWGVLGVAYACSVYTVLTRLPTIMVCFYKTPLRLSDFFSSIWRPSTASICSGFALYCVGGFLSDSVPVLVDLVLCGLLYFPTFVAIYVLIPGGRGDLLAIWRIAGLLRKPPPSCRSDGPKGA